MTRDHVRDADADHRQGEADEEVGRDREDVAGLTQPAEVRGRDQGDRNDRDNDARVVQARDHRIDLGDRRCRRDGDGHHVVDQEGGRGNEARQRTEVLLRHRVRAAARRIGPADLLVREGDHREQDRDGDRDPEREDERSPGAGQDENPQDLLGRVGRRADRVRAEDREGLLLRQALADLLLARERPADRDLADPRPDPPQPRLRLVGGRLGDHLPTPGVPEVGRVGAIDADAPVGGFSAGQGPAASDHRTPICFALRQGPRR